MTNTALQSHTVVAYVPIEPVEEEFSQYFWSAFGLLLALYTTPRSTLGRVLAESSSPVSLHKLSDYAQYTSAPILAHDEPLFTRGRWKRVVEHKTYGLGTPLYRKITDSGIPVVVVQYGHIERTLAIGCANSDHWITPLASIEKVKVKPVTVFKFRDGSPDKKDPYSPRFSHCVQCGEEFMDTEGKPTPSRFEFCGETELSSGACKRAWNEAHPPALPPHQASSKFMDYDPAWDKLRAKALEQRFTGFKNFCPNCIEVMVHGPDERILGWMKGVYRAKDHECGVIRVEMIPAMKAVRKNARKITHESCNDRRQGDIQCNHHRRYSDVTPGKQMVGGVELPVSFEKHVFSIGLSPEIAKLETALLKADCSKRADSRAYELWETDQSERQIPKTALSCQHCGTSVARRKGSKFCSDNCRKEAFRVRVIQ
jgi:hypothetical protein